MLKIHPDSHWLKIRLISLITTFLSISLSGIYYFYFFQLSQFQEESVNFPNSFPLKTWKLESRTSLNLSSSKGYQYIYSQNQRKLTIEMIDKKYSGNISHFLIIHKNIPPATVLIQEKYDPSLGYYGLFQHQEKMYLTACLNPQGYSTLTEEQFTQNRYRYGGGIKRTLRWIIGQDDLFNSHCLWTLISLDTQDYASFNENITHELKSIWLESIRLTQQKIHTMTDSKLNR